MTIMRTDDPRVTEIGETWLDFLEKVHDDLPDTATAISLGQVLMYLMQEYKPPVDEIADVLGVVLTVYAATQEVVDKRKMN
jgi:hypothetical protein